MGGLFSSAKMPNVPAVPPAPAKTDAEIEEAARKERLAQRQRRGRASTILTGSGGVQDQAPVGKKTLLGE